MVATNFYARAAVLLAAARYVSAVGTAIIHNKCDFDVYLWSVSVNSGDMQTLSANGGEYSESYRTNPDGGGISIKVGRDTAGSNVTQYEYTLESGSLWYDLSLINGYPFVDFGVTVKPSDSSCSAVVCPAGVEACAAAYMVPTDNWATAECDSSTDTHVLLCSGDESTTPSSSSVLASSATSTTVASSTSTSASSTSTTTSSTSVVEASSTSVVEASTTSSTTATPTSTSISTPASTTTETEPTHTWHHGTHTAFGVEEPAATAAGGSPDVVMQTTFVTYVVTVEARNAAPTPAAVVRRGIHRHEHGQQRRHEHGHVHHAEDA